MVFLDAMGLGGLTGPEVLREITEKYDQLPVVLLVGCREELRSSAEAAVVLDARACLQKPFELEELLQVLADIRREELCRLLPRTASTLLSLPDVGVGRGFSQERLVYGTSIGSEQIL